MINVSYDPGILQYMSQREWRYQIKSFKLLLEKKGRVATKEDNASSKCPMKKKERPPKRQ
jgi:hypothetical protein